MQRTAVWVVTSMIGLAFEAVVSAQPAPDPTMRILDDTSDVARVLDDLDGRRAAAPPADRAGERRRQRLDARDDERGESALDDDDVARALPPAVGP